MTNPFEKPDFHQQLQADQTTLITMLADQKALASQLVPEAGDPLELHDMRGTMHALHQTYVGALKKALILVNSMLDDESISLEA